MLLGRSVPVLLAALILCRRLPGAPALTPAVCPGGIDARSNGCGCDARGVLIAAGIMVTGRYCVGKVEVYKDDIGIVYGLDNWRRSRSAGCLSQPCPCGPAAWRLRASLIGRRWVSILHAFLVSCAASLA
jgi:hypothetical protein